jgi:hypothetical protein
MYDLHRDLLDALRAAPEVLEGLLEGVSQREAITARGGDEGWSVVEVLCHLRDAEERAVERARAMRDEQSPLLPAYDQGAWAIERNYASARLHEALEGFQKQRSAHLALLEALEPAAWDRPGRHAEQGEITIFAHTLHIVAHDAIHAAQIARQLADRERGEVESF